MIWHYLSFLTCIIAFLNTYPVYIHPVEKQKCIWSITNPVLADDTPCNETLGLGRCLNGDCFELRHRCDGIVNCASDGYDEIGCKSDMVTCVRWMMMKLSQPFCRSERKPAGSSSSQTGWPSPRCALLSIERLDLESNIHQVHIQTTQLLSLSYLKRMTDLLLQTFWIERSVARCSRCQPWFRDQLIHLPSRPRSLCPPASLTSNTNTADLQYMLWYVFRCS